MALLTLAVSSCVSSVEGSATPAAPVASAPRPAPPALLPRVPVLVLSAFEGTQAARARAAFATPPPALRECRPGAGGLIRLQLTGAGAGAHYSVVSPTSLDSTQRRCVLEALSTVEIEGISGDASPSARPSGFTGQIRVEW